jgi:tRNA threonylcarbamoyladenosine biosynthesis protein TsaB
MPILLSIETSTRVCSVALQNDETILGSATLHIERSHAGLLAVLAERLLKSCGVLQTELNGVIVAEGPGSYTGLRIGTSFAKGLCYVLNVPLITVGSLEALAYGVAPFIAEPAFLIPMMDARRMEVYLQVLNEKAEPFGNAKPFLLESEDLLEYLDDRKCYFFGNGSEKAKSVITHSNARFIDGIEADARYMCRPGFRKFIAGEFADLAYFEPEYLKEFQATKPKKLI